MIGAGTILFLQQEQTALEQKVHALTAWRSELEQYNQLGG